MRTCKDSRIAITNLRVIHDGSTNATLYTAVLSLRPSMKVNRDMLLSHIRGIHRVQDVEET